jgi:hypothetical protein
MSRPITLTSSIKIDVHAWVSQSSFSDDLSVRLGSFGRDAQRRAKGEPPRRDGAPLFSEPTSE